MAPRLVQRKGVRRYTYELEGAKLTVTVASPFSSDAVTLPGEVLFGDRSQARTSSWFAFALAAVYVIVTASAIFEPDRPGDELAVSAAIAVAAALWFWTSRSIRRTYTLAGSQVTFFDGRARGPEIDAFVDAGQAALRTWIRPRILPFRSGGNLVADADRVEWLHAKGILTDEEHASIIERLKRMIAAAARAEDQVGGDDDGLGRPRSDDIN